MSTENKTNSWASSGGGGWRARTAAAAAAPAPEGEAPVTRTSMDGWGERSGQRSGGERSGGRPMPAAFGGGDKQNSRLEEQRRRAESDAAQKRKEERERIEAETKRKRMMDFGNADEYPSLGGGGGGGLCRPVSVASAIQTAPAPKHILDFRAASERGAILSAAREAEEEALARAEYHASCSARLEAEERAAHRRRLAQITTHCYDDGFDEHEPPTDDDDGGAVAAAAPEYEEEEEEDLREAGAGARATGEFNAHLAVSRRAGDKSNW